MAKPKRVYLDHHAATPLTPAVRDAMEVARHEGWANPASTHQFGRAARKHLESARGWVAATVGGQPADVVLTGGGTEACNLAVLGIAPDAQRVVTTSIEHPAVDGAVQVLQDRGARVVRLPVRDGQPPSPQAFAGVIRGADLAAIQWVNHETGTILPVEEYAEACRASGVPLIVDGTQALGKLEVDVSTLGAQAVAFASSKIGGPLGAGALWVDRAVELHPRAVGGGQERGRRGGTPDAVAAAGFGAACADVASRLIAMNAVARRRDALETQAYRLGFRVNAGDTARVATVASISLQGARGSVMVAALDLEGLCASSGAACSSGVDEPSPVLRAMYPREGWRAEGALRLSLGPSTTDADIDFAIAVLSKYVHRHNNPVRTSRT